MPQQTNHYNQHTRTKRDAAAEMRYPLAVIQPQKDKQKCCKKYKDGKQCKKCPLRD